MKLVPRVCRDRCHTNFKLQASLNGAAARLDVAIFTPTSGAHAPWQPPLYSQAFVVLLTSPLGSLPLSLSASIAIVHVRHRYLHINRPLPPHMSWQRCYLPFLASDASGDFNSVIRVRAIGEFIFLFEWRWLLYDYCQRTIVLHWLHKNRSICILSVCEGCNVLATQRVVIEWLYLL